MSFRQYGKAKDSGVERLGFVPDHWHVSRLGFESWVRARLGWKGLKAEDLLSTPNIKGQAIDFENVNYIDQFRYDESPEIKLRIGDVLLAKDGSTLGTVNVVRSLPRSATANSSIAVITPREALAGLFLYFLFQSSYLEHTIQEIKGGMGVPHLFQEYLNKFYIPPPPIGEQLGIAEFLDHETAKIDGLVAEQQRLITLLKEKRQAVISHAVTKGLNPAAPMKDSGIEWLGKVPESWELLSLGRVTKDRCDGPFGSGLKSEHYTEQGVRVIRLQNIRHGMFAAADSAYNIVQKVKVVVEHFRENVAVLLNGKAKAMVVVASRKEAVRWQLAIDKYIKERGYKFAALVAFSGEVLDPESGPDPFSETSRTLNPNLRGREIREAFATDEYQVLLVANKFQTGFDQPLLCGMYVDKRLAGITAVQTLSRLNRAYDGKDTTYVVDFVNDPEEILKAFKTYYETAELSDVTDPHLVFDLRMKLDSAGYYDDFEVNRVVEAVLNSKKQSELTAALEPVLSRLLVRYKSAQERFRIAEARDDAKVAGDAKQELDALTLFKHDVAVFQRVYTFLSQIFDYGNTDIEKRHIFYKALLPSLEFGREREGIDLSKIFLTHHNLKDQGKRDVPLCQGENPKLSPLTESGGGSVQEKEKARLEEIITRVNDLFEGELTDDDQLVYVNNVIKGKLLESMTLVQQAANNTKEQFGNSPDLNNELVNAIMDALAAHNTMSKQALESERVRTGLRDILLGPAQLYEALRERAESKADAAL